MFDDLNDFETPLGKFLACVGCVGCFLLIPVLLWAALLA